MCFGPCLSSFLFFCYAGANLNFKTNGKQFLWVIWFDEKFTFKVNRECSKFISVVTSPMGKLREVHNGSCLFYVFFSSSFSGNGMYSTVLYFIFHFSSPPKPWLSSKFTSDQNNLVESRFTYLYSSMYPNKKREVLSSLSFNSCLLKHFFLS